jgi:ribosome-binding factor A
VIIGCTARLLRDGTGAIIADDAAESKSRAPDLALQRADRTPLRLAVSPFPVRPTLQVLTKKISRKVAVLGDILSMRRRFSGKPMPSLASERGPDDGIDPRTMPRSTGGRVANRKALQLCRQVEQTLGSVLAGGCGDAVLRDLLVQSVVPAPDSTRLLVTLSFSGPATVDAGELLAHLQRAQGLLRSEVAAAIHRRKVPDLTFHVV